MALPVPQIDNGKRPEDPTLVHVHLIPLPNDTPYGNLLLKWSKIVARIDDINVRLGEAYASYARAMSAHFTVAKPFEHEAIAEEVVYWMRKTADEIIGLCDFMLQAVEDGEYPTSLRTDRIGSALKVKRPGVTKHLNEHRAFLTLLNEISNGYKHSFINSEVSLLGRDEPVVFALGLKYNRLAGAPQYHAVALSRVVDEFSRFYTAMQLFLREKNVQLQSLRRSAGPWTV